MRVRLTRQTDIRRRPAPTRRPHVVPAPDPAQAPPREAGVPEDRAAGDDDALAAERRWRDAGGPEDHAVYRCGCGFVFEARVSTSVQCPHCGAGQAW